MPADTRIELQDAKVKAAIERLRRSLPLGGDMTPAFRTIGRIVKSGSQRRFIEQKSPEGIAWKPSRRALEEGGQTLRLTGRLQRSLTYEADHASAEIGTNAIYGRIQHLGGVAGRNHRSRLVARPYLGAGDAERVEIVDALNDYLSRGWRG